MNVWESGEMGSIVRISRPNARFQQWEALLRNRNKRQRAGEFLVHGVRPISLAVEHEWPVRAVLYDSERTLSRWAEDILGRAGGERVAMAPELLQQLGDKEQEVPELIAPTARCWPGFRSSAPRGIR